MARERESWQRDDKRDYGSDDLGYTNDDDAETRRSQGRSGGEFRGGGRWRGGQQGRGGEGQRTGEEYGEGRYGQDSSRGYGGSEGRYGQQGRTYQSGRDPYRQGQGYEGGYQGERGYAGSRGGFASYGMGEGGGYGQGGDYGGQRDYQRRGSQDRDFWDRASDEVSSWLGDDDAERRRRMDQHRGKGPRGYTRSDERIKEDVNDRLTDDWAVDASGIDVDVESCEVTLTGEVPSREMKRRAEDVAEAVSGVKHVQNNIRVKQSEQTSGETGGRSGTTSL